MKIRIRKARSGMTVSFKARCDEGADLMEAVLSTGRSRNAALSIIENLAGKGYTGDVVESGAKLKLDAIITRKSA
jgi:hypothetical protein